MPSLDPTRRIPVFSLFLTIGAWITFFATLGSPSDPKNAFLFGYSFERILLGGGVLALGVTLLILTIKLFRNLELSQRLWALFTQPHGMGNAALFVSFAFAMLGWVILSLPDYRLGAAAGYVERLSPILTWLTTTSAVAAALLLIERKRRGQISFQQDRILLQVAGIVFGLLILLGVVVLTTGIGYRQPEDYWYGAGVPVLGLQVLFSLLLGAVVLWLEPQLTTGKKIWFDVAVFSIVWLTAAWVWAREPLVANYFMPDTADNVIYPYSDGATFDMGGQYALIGQGLFNGQYFDRALYSAFLAYLHMLFGQDFSVLMTVQAAVYAVFPAILYLIGKELHSRALGISAAVLIAIRGWNTIITAKWIDTASPKMILTDFPTAIGIAIFLLFFLKWLKDPAHLVHLMWAGAAFGLTLMVRTHALTLLPVVLVFIPFFWRVRWKQFMLIASLLLLGLLTVTLPWEIRNQSKGIPMFYMYYSRIELLLRYRYGILEDAYVPPQRENPSPAQNLSVLNLPRQRAVRAANDPVCNSLPCSMVNHFVHNIIASIVSMPSSFVFDDLWNTVKADTPYWKKDWNEGQVGAVGAFLLMVNLGMISLGMGAIWKHHRSLALLPVLLFLAYLFTNSIGLTSGGRYVAPVDWIVMLYFMAGAMQLIAWLLRMAGFVSEHEAVAIGQHSLPSLSRTDYLKVIPAFAFILGVGALIPLSETFFEPRYQVRTSQEILAELDEAGLLERSGYSMHEWSAFLSQPTAMMNAGRALYPRYYRIGEGEPDRSTYYRFYDYQRLVFTLIGPYSTASQGIIIPGDPPPLSLHTADVVVFGCWNTSYYAPFLDAVAVFVTSGDGYVYTRAPQALLKCPLPQP